MNDNFYKCITIRLGKYPEGGDPTFDIEAAKHLTKAFALWFDDCHYDKERNWLSFELAYPIECIWAPEMLSAIKFFALQHDFSVLGDSTCFKPLEDDILQEGC